MTCAPLEKLGQYDWVLIVTDHSDYDYKNREGVKLVVDTRNATKGSSQRRLCIARQQSAVSHQHSAKTAPQIYADGADRDQKSSLLDHV